MSKYSEELLEWAMECLVRRPGYRNPGVVHPDSIHLEVTWVTFIDTAECCEAQYYDEECTCVEDSYERVIKVSGEEPLHHYYMRADGYNVSRRTPHAYVFPEREPRFEELAEEITRANNSSTLQ